MDRILRECSASNLTFLYDEKYKEHLNLFVSLVDELDELIVDKQNINKFCIMDNDNIGGCTIHILTNTCALFNCGMVFNYEFSNGRLLAQKLADRHVETQANFVSKEQYTGIFSEIGKKISFSREYGQHRFTDEECEALLRGETITYKATSSTGNLITFTGKLERQEYNNYEYYGFKKADIWDVPQQFAKHTFTKEEKTALEQGNTIVVDAIVRGQNKKIQISFNSRKGITVLDWNYE